MSDSDLIKELIDKQPQAFRQLIEKYQRLVFNACYNLTRSTQDAEDITQEVFIEVYESVHQFRHESKLSTWLYRVAVNKSLNHLRKNRMKNMLHSIEQFFKNDNGAQLDIEDPSAANTPYSIDYTERSQVLMKAINSLPENQRIAFTLNKYDELSYQEITEIMGISLSSVESLIHRAKLNLQKKLITYYKN
jgi:RNA polymerase sigma-70 factor (ECF subfamily)